MLGQESLNYIAARREGVERTRTTGHPNFQVCYGMAKDVPGELYLLQEAQVVSRRVL